MTSSVYLSPYSWTCLFPVFTVNINNVTSFSCFYDNSRLLSELIFLNFQWEKLENLLNSAADLLIRFYLSRTAWFCSLTHNALLWSGRHDVTDVEILGGQFTVQTQKITETSFHWEIPLFKQRHGRLRHRETRWIKTWCFQGYIIQKVNKQPLVNN